MARRQPVDSWRGRRGRSVSAWLAIVALLLNGLLPIGFSLAPAADTPAIGFCGHPPAPDHKQRLPGAAHCIYCLVAPVGPVPIPVPTLAAPRLLGVVVLPASRPRLIDRPKRFAAAQPRGPPGVA
jgi:hypothetical protein